MGTRHRQKMRRVIDVTLESVAAGDVTREFAAQKLASIGVPLSVIGRVLHIAVTQKDEVPSVNSPDAQGDSTAK